MSAKRSPHGVGLGSVNTQSSFSQRSNLPPYFRVRVYNDRLFPSILEDGSRVCSPPGGSYGSAKSKSSHPPNKNRANTGAARVARTARRAEQYKVQLAQKQLLQDRLLKDHLLNAAEQKEKEFVRLSADVTAGHTIVNELDRVLGIADEAERNKTFKQFQEWDANVHGAIQRRIDEELAVMDVKDINERRREDLDKFLATTNSKSSVFRDIIIESEYDPLEPNRRAIKAQVRRLHNPCSRVLDKRAEENGILAAEAGAGATNPVMRETFNVELWDERRVEDTPHGFFAKMMGREAVKDKLGGEKTTSKTYKSTVKMDDYNVDHGRDIVTKEFPKGKRTYQAGDEFAPNSSKSSSLIGMG
ncbi:unnamed protein product [Laminaria digitata]